MFLYFTFYSIFLFIPIICGNNTSSSPSVADTKVISNKTATVEHTTSEFNKTKVEMLSEGGSVLPALPILPSMTLPKENHTNLLGLDKELGKTKEKPVVGRKGVVYNPLEDNTLAKADIRSDRVDTSVHKIPIANNTSKIQAPVNNATKVLSPVNNSLTPISSKDVMHNVTQTTTTIPRKPLILSYEALNAVGKKSETAQLHKMETSSKSEVTDQLPTPNIKVQMSTNRHPGMVMPIVITMLVVPMFAVLGYMALRRGQEAWKNRHYKRMDFLLDGMYNE